MRKRFKYSNSTGTLYSALLRKCSHTMCLMVFSVVHATIHDCEAKMCISVNVHCNLCAKSLNLHKRHLMFIILPFIQRILLSTKSTNSSFLAIIQFQSFLCISFPNLQIILIVSHHKEPILRKVISENVTSKDRSKIVGQHFGPSFSAFYEIIYIYL